MGTETDVDVYVIGSGPHGLATTLELQSMAPYTKVAVADPSGQWLHTWHEQMARAEISTLRSPIVHSPVADPWALGNHCDAHKLPRSGLPYEIPTVSAFKHFCDHLIDDAELPTPVAARVERVEVTHDTAHITTSTGTVTAAHVVVASNPQRRNIPTWVLPLLGRAPGRIDHAAKIDLRTIPDLSGEEVAVIGGGQSAAHLAAGAVARGAHVTFLTRRPIQLRDFDTNPGWLGPKLLRAWGEEKDPTRRVQSALTARGGGSMPSWMARKLVALADDGHLTFQEDVQIDSAEFDSSSRLCLMLNNGAAVLADRLWLATGGIPDITASRYLDEVIADLPVVDGFPIIDDSLRLPNRPIFVTGRLATSVLGPAAGNLWGAQRAAQRIANRIAGH